MGQVRQTDSSASSNALLPHDSILGDSCIGERTASAASLLGLPAELQKNILEYLTTNADKKNVCLTYKEMQILATPLLYKNMEIFANRLDETLLATLKEDHSGLSQVRTLRIKPHGLWKFGAMWSDERELQAKIVYRLLHVIPKNFLTLFEHDIRVPNSSVIGAGIRFAVRLRQAKVCSYQFVSGVDGVIGDGHLDWDMIAPTVDELAHVTSLQIYFRADDYDQFDRAALILARTPALRHLDLELETYDIYDDGECCDAAVRILQNMFHSRMETGQPTRLKSLRIASMCLLEAGVLLPDIMDLSMLEHLQLVWCTDIDPFLRHLGPLNLSLSSLRIEDFHRVDKTDFAVNDFIRSLKPLKRIMLKFTGIWYFSLRTLQHHYPSLESLCIEGKPFEQAMVPTTGLAPNLEQLALFGSKLEVGRIHSGPAPFYDIRELLDMLKPLKSLRVLKLTTVCSSLCVKRTPTEMLCMPPVLRAVKRTAEQIFELKLPKLTAVVFVGEGQRDRLLTHKRFAFLLSKQLGGDGVVKTSVIPVEPHMVKHHVPCADILEPDRFVFV